MSVVLDITTDQQTAAPVCSDTLALADRHCLTVYDAAYLELASRKGLALATLDQDLHSAAKKAKIKLARGAI
nr:type II toxin-antitoxin system VapC family toxin [uncultured Rhodopila sp.]